MADLKTLFGIFIGVIIAVTLVGAIADSVFNAQNTISVSQENISIAGARTNSEGGIHPNITFNLANDFLLSTEAVVLGGATLVEGTDYHINDTGDTVGDTAATFSIINTSDTGNMNFNATSWNYTHAGDNYIQGNAANRTLIGLVTLFFVIAILAFVLVFLKNTELFSNVIGGRR